MNRHFTLLCALGLFACATEPTSQAATTGTPTAGFGQVANVGPLKVRPLGLVEDSRCPIDVQCVWAGRLTIKAEIDGGAGVELAPLTLDEPLDLGGISVTLISAEPGNIDGKDIKRSDYRFTFAYSNNR